MAKSTVPVVVNPLVYTKKLEGAILGKVVYHVTTDGHVYRALMPYKKGNKVYYNIIINGKLRRVSQSELAAHFGEAGARTVQ